MKNIMFVGDGMNGYFAQEVAQTRGWQYYQIDADADIKKATNDILTFIYSRKISIDIIIYDADVFLNDAAVIAKEIRGAANTISAKPIVYMPSFLPESALAGALLANDIKNYILSGSTADLKDQLEKNITGFFDATDEKKLRKFCSFRLRRKHILTVLRPLVSQEVRSVSAQQHSVCRLSNTCRQKDTVPVISN